jgi:hypothetical protein
MDHEDHEGGVRKSRAKRGFARAYEVENPIFLAKSAILHRARKKPVKK